MRLRISRLLAAGILLSIVLHFTLGPLFVWLFYRHPHPEPVETIYVARSSAMRIEHRTHPQHPRKAVKQPRAPRRIEPQHAQPQRQTPPQPVRRPAPQQRREIARFDRRSINPPPAHAFALNAPAQERQFERTIARLRAENNPVTSAARAVQTPAASKRYTFDFSGSIGNAPQAEGILTPDRSWRDGGYDYYYVRYWVQYADSTTETGQVPWPIRYRPAVDPFRLGIEHFPLPGPMPDFALPGGSNLHPLVAFCYKHRADFDFCPIYHE